MTIDDKTLHVWAGMLISIVIGWICILFDLYYWSALIALVSGTLVGIAKEVVWDKMLGKGTPSKEDAIATWWGSMVGCVIIIVSVSIWYK